jgi:hypothetical protein
MLGLPTGGVWLPPKNRDRRPNGGSFRKKRMLIEEKRLKSGENSTKMGGGVCVLAHFLLRENSFYRYNQHF